MQKHHIDGEAVTLYGYSHGGNVSIQAVPLIRQALGEDVQINVVTLFTPAQNFQTPENPSWIKDDINVHIHFYSSSDKVAPIGQGGVLHKLLLGEGDRHYYPHAFPKSRNGRHEKLIEVDVDDYLGKGESPAGHGSVYFPGLMKRSAQAVSGQDNRDSGSEQSPDGSGDPVE